jgi:hypothetical protein
MSLPYLFLHRCLESVANAFSPGLFHGAAPAERASAGRRNDVSQGETHMNRRMVLTGGALLALTLGGCGGGGGGAPPGPTPTGTINTRSALDIAGRAVDLALQSGSFGGITDFVGLTVVSASEPGSVGGGRLTKPGSPQYWAGVPFGPETRMCTEDGTETVSGDIASPLTVTAGDFLDYRWNGCDDGFGQVIDGLIRLTFTEFEGDLLAGRILLRVSLSVQDFRVLEGSDFRISNGDLSLTIDSRTQPETLIETLGNSLVVTSNDSTETLSDFSSIVIEDTSMFPSNFTTDVTGTILSTLFEGSVSYSMPIPFQSSGDSFPYQGEMLIAGSDGATIRIIALDQNKVRIEADFNGDGALDSTTDTTWSALTDG